MDCIEKNIKIFISNNNVFHQVLDSTDINSGPKDYHIENISLQTQ